MKLIVGLGNPGRRYAATAHNMGFEVVDRLARRWGLALRTNERCEAEIAEGQVASVPAMLVRPQTFMNLSGRAVAALTRQRELGADDLLVITDDVNLPIGPAAHPVRRQRRRAQRPQVDHRVPRHGRLRAVAHRHPPRRRNRRSRPVRAGEASARGTPPAGPMPTGRRRRPALGGQGAAATADRFNGLKPFAEQPGDDV